MKMKTSLFVLSLFAGFALLQACQSEDALQAQTSKETVQAQASSESVVFDMQNMTCAMCGITIKKSLQNVDGVQSVNVDDDNKTASVTFDPAKTNHESLIKATTDAGYPGTVHPAK